MSLRARVVALIGGVLLLSMLLGALVAGVETRVTLKAELAAGMDGAQQTVASALQDLPKSDHSTRDLRQLIATFDGNRHVRAALAGPDGRPMLASRTETPDRPAPRWFRRLLGPDPAPVHIAVPGATAGARVILSPTGELDVASAWREFLGVVAVLIGSAALGLTLVYLVIGAAFRPLRALSEQFARVGAGDYTGRVAEAGPTELLGLQRGFNRMAGELAATTERNRLLGDQLLTIQEEERAEIARDLHDDIGPNLFAVNLDAEMIIQLGEAGRHAAIPEQVRAIQAGVRHIQRQVRELLARLRPTPLTELGLNAALRDLVGFWSQRRPDIAFHTELPDEMALAEAVKDVAYRVVQEAVSNAVRHGQPHEVRIALRVVSGRRLTVSVADDGRGQGEASGAGGGLGLVGMRERVAALGGDLSFGPTRGAPGWTTQAELELGDPAAPARLESVA